jgi:Family of unknown function (DUF6152)
MKFITARVLKLVGIGAIFAIPTAHAHHSAAAAFTTNIISVEGYVTEFNFTNPHVNISFDVKGEDGKTTQWVATDSAANLLRRRGWTAETVKPGQYLRVTGRETRDGSPMILVERIVELDPKDGSIVRNVRGESDYEEIVAADLPLKLADGRPNFMGAWTMGPPVRGRTGPPVDPTPPPFNATGLAMQAKFDPINDPAVGCKPPGLARQAGFTPHPVRVTQEADRVLLEYEEYGGRRVVYFDDRDIASDEHTNLGHSIAHYDGDTLVIETKGLLGNYTSPMGNPLSDQTTTVETYRRADDQIGAALEMQMAITDPAHLRAPWNIKWKKYYTPGYEFIKVDCRVPSTYRESK